MSTIPVELCIQAQFLIESDSTIRMQQAHDRRQADEALKENGNRLWVSGSTIHDLPIRNIPDVVEDAFGYSGQARIVGFFLGVGEECYYDDGCTLSTSEIDAFLLFVQHRSIAPRLQGFFFGSSEEDASHWLMMDRQFRQITVVSAQLGRVMVAAQWRRPLPEPVLIVDGNEWTRLVETVNAKIMQMPAEGLFALEMQRQNAVLELLSWLEAIK